MVSLGKSAFKPRTICHVLSTVRFGTVVFVRPHIAKARVSQNTVLSIEYIVLLSIELSWDIHFNDKWKSRMLMEFSRCLAYQCD